MNEENIEVVCDSPGLNATVDNVVELFKNNEEEVEQLTQRKWSLEADVQHFRKVVHFLEQEKAELDEDVARLKLRNAAYQREHTNLRNSITVVKFQIEKIKETITEAKANDLRALEDFEKTVDEITEKFRSGPATYDRKTLLEKIEREKERRRCLLQKLEDVREAHESFNRAHGLRDRENESEDLLGCILPGSTLSCFIEMTKTLDEVISGIKNSVEESNRNEKNSDSALHRQNLGEPGKCLT